MGTLGRHTCAEAHGGCLSEPSPVEVSSGTPPALFSGIQLSEYAAISATARPKSLLRGEMLFFKGDIARQVVLLTSGIIKSTQVGPSGMEVIVRLSTPGDVLGVSGALMNGKHDSTAHAFRSCRVLTWEARAFRMLAERFPILHQNLVGILGRDLLELEERFHEVATEKVEARVARQLIRLESKMGFPTAEGIQVRISREELAQMTGTTLFTVSRLLSNWDAMGAVKPSREAVTVLDHHLLLAAKEDS